MYVYVLDAPNGKTNMTTFFTSDHHFGHANILKYEDASRRNVHGGRFASIDKTEPDRPPMINVGIDMWNLRPISEAEIVQKYLEILR